MCLGGYGSDDITFCNDRCGLCDITIMILTLVIGGMFFIILGPTIFFCGDPSVVGDYSRGTCTVLGLQRENFCGRNRAVFQVSISDGLTIVSSSAAALGGDWCGGGDGSQDNFINDYPIGTVFDCWYRSSPLGFPLGNECDILEIQSFTYDNFDGSDAQIGLFLLFTLTGAICCCPILCGLALIATKLSCGPCEEQYEDWLRNEERKRRTKLQEQFKWEHRWDYVRTSFHQQGYWTHITEATPETKRKDFTRILPKNIVLYIFELLILLPDHPNQSWPHPKAQLSELGRLSSVHSIWYWYTSHSELWTKIFQHYTPLNSVLDDSWDPKVTVINGNYHGSFELTQFHALSLFQKKTEKRKSSFFLDLESKELRLSKLGELE